MMTGRIAVFALLTGCMPSAACAQQAAEETVAEEAVTQETVAEEAFTEETLTEESFYGEHAAVDETEEVGRADAHTHTQDEDHEGRARPVTVRTAPEQASAALEHVTWELLSRMAAQLLSGNRAALLSGNEPEVLSENQTNVASGNKLEVLSGNKISLFSNIKIRIEISGVPNPAEVMGGQREIRIETSDAGEVEVRPQLRNPREETFEQPSNDIRLEAPELQPTLDPSDR